MKRFGIIAALFVMLFGCSLQSQAQLFGPENGMKGKMVYGGNFGFGMSGNYLNLLMLRKLVIVSPMLGKLACVEPITSNAILTVIMVTKRIIGLAHQPTQTLKSHTASSLISSTKGCIVCRISTISNPKRRNVGIIAIS